MVKDLINKYDPNQRISVAVDCIIFGFDSKNLKLLLFKRKVEPFKGDWSLIGALIRNEVSLDEGANEVIFNLTGLHDIYLKQLKTYGAVDRDPLERVISVAYYSLIRIDTFDDEQLETYGAKWHSAYSGGGVRLFLVNIEYLNIGVAVNRLRHYFFFIRIVS